MITGTSPMDVGRHRKAVVDRLLEDLVVAVADCFESDPVLSWDAYKYLSMLVLTLPRRFIFKNGPLLVLTQMHVLVGTAPISRRVLKVLDRQRWAFLKSWPTPERRSQLEEGSVCAIVVGLDALVTVLTLTIPQYLQFRDYECALLTNGASQL